MEKQQIKQIMKTTYLTSVMILLLMGCTSKVNQPTESLDIAQKIIFETDMGNDIDDALALDMLHKYQDDGVVDLIAVMTNKESKYSAEYIDVMNTWYGYSQIPIGVIHNGADCENDAENYAKHVSLMKDDTGELKFKRSIDDYDELLEAHILYRKILSDQEDSSVTVISVGFSTNLARLLDTKPDDISNLSGKELVAKKVKILSVMAGNFNGVNPSEYNVVKDISAAKKVFDEWPTPIVISPFEVGIAINYPGESIENDFNWAPHHPMVEGYKVYLEMPYDRPTWDLTSVLYAVEGPSYFNMSPSGSIKVNDKGGTEFNPAENANRYYLTVDSVQAEKIKNRFINLISKKPSHF